jgi:AAA+ superfamily predicted ATPase
LEPSVSDPTPHEPGATVIAAIRAALDASPDDLALRAHLAALLVDAGEHGDPSEALDHARTVLAHRPDDVAALRTAARAAEGVGDITAAMGYWRLHDALAVADGPRGVAPAPGPAPDLATVPMDGGATESTEAPWEVERPGVTLADVAGLEQVQRRLRTMFLAPLEHPELRAAFGASLGGGLLLYGPPGCGKTHLARCLAGELGTRFLSIGLHDVLDMYLGNSERAVHGVFEHARRNAPMILFLDEVDALGQSRSRMHGQAMRNVVVQLLTELDGISGSNEGVFVLGATNQPWDLDPALRRPGRFDRVVFVPPPDEPARRGVLEVHLRPCPVAPDVDLAALAEQTAGFSGADLRAVVVDATQAALVASVDTGHVRPIAHADLVRAVRDRRPSTTAWFEMAQNVLAFANDSGDYDDMADHMRSRGRRRR